MTTTGFVVLLHTLYHKKYLSSKIHECTNLVELNAAHLLARRGPSQRTLCQFGMPVAFSAAARRAETACLSRAFAALAPLHQEKEFRCADRMWLPQHSASHPGSWRGHSFWVRPRLSPHRMRLRHPSKSARKPLKRPRAPGQRPSVVRAEPRPCHLLGSAPGSRPAARGHSRSALWLEPVSRPFSRCGSGSRADSTVPVVIQSPYTTIGAATLGT